MLRERDLNDSKNKVKQSRSVNSVIYLAVDFKFIVKIVLVV